MGAEIKKDIGMRLIKKIHLHLCVCITTLMAAICFNHLASAIPLGFEERFKRMPTDKNLVEAQELLKKGKPDEAIEKVNQAIRTNPNSPNSALAHEFLGKILIMEGEIDKGLKELQKAVELRPLQSSAITKIGDVHLARKEYEKARESFLKVISINPTDRRAHQQLGILYEMDEKYGLAIKHYEEALKGAHPGYIGIKVNLGRLYNLSKRYSETVDLLAHLVTPDNKNPIAHIVLGTAYLGLRKTDLAFNEFEIVRQLDPDSERSYLSLGIAYRETGKYLQSLVALIKVIIIKPKCSTCYFQLGETYFAMKDFDQALKEYKKAEKNSSNPFLIRKREAEVYLAQKKPEETITIYKRMIKDRPDHISLYDLLGSVYQFGGQLELAEKTFEEMVEKFPKNPFAYYKLGLFYGFIKKYDLAVNNLEKGLSLSPNNPTILYHLGTLHQSLGNKKAAKENLEKALSISQNFNDANNAKKILKQLQ